MNKSIEMFVGYDIMSDEDMVRFNIINDGKQKINEKVFSLPPHIKIIGGIRYYVFDEIKTQELFDLLVKSGFKESNSYPKCPYCEYGHASVRDENGRVIQITQCGKCKGAGVLSQE